MSIYILIKELQFKIRAQGSPELLKTFIQHQLNVNLIYLLECLNIKMLIF